MDPVVNAFAHAISSILDYLVASAAKSSTDFSQSPLISLWSAFEDHELALSELCDLCGIVGNLSELRELSIDPSLMVIGGQHL